MEVYSKPTLPTVRLYTRIKSYNLVLFYELGMKDSAYYWDMPFSKLYPTSHMGLSVEDSTSKTWWQVGSPSSRDWWMLGIPAACAPQVSHNATGWHSVCESLWRLCGVNHLPTLGKSPPDSAQIRITWSCHSLLCKTRRGFHKSEKMWKPFLY